MRLGMTLVMLHAPSELVRSNRDSMTLLCDASRATINIKRFVFVSLP